MSRRLPIPALVLAALLPMTAARAQQPASPSTAGTAAEIAKTANPELVGMLTSQLGITPKQAEGGSGAVFGYAKSKLKKNDYTKVAKAVPGIDGLIKAAPAPEPQKQESASGLGTLSGIASQAGGSVGAVAALTPAFQKLGLSGETVSQFLPVVVGYVTKKGGTGTGNILGNLFK